MTETNKRDKPCKGCGKECREDNKFLCPKYQKWLRRAEKWLHGLTYDGLPKGMYHEIGK